MMTGAAEQTHLEVSDNAIIPIFFKLIKFIINSGNASKLIASNETIESLIYELFRLLEYDPQSEERSAYLLVYRDRLKNDAEKKSSAWKTLKKILYEDRTLYDALYKRKSFSKDNSFESLINQFDHPDYLNNPLMSSYYILNSKMKYALRGGLSPMKSTIGSDKLRCLAVEVFEAVLNLKQDCHLKSVLKHFGRFSPKLLSSRLKENSASMLLGSFISENVSHMIPKPPKSGILQLDLIRDNSMLFNACKCSDILMIQNFDKFYLKDVKNASCMVSLLVNFIGAHNPKLKTALCNLIARLFNQVEEFIMNLNKVEVLCDDRHRIMSELVSKKVVWLTTKSYQYLSQIKPSEHNLKNWKKIVESIVGLSNLLEVERGQDSKDRTLELNKLQNIHCYKSSYIAVISLQKFLVPYLQDTNFVDDVYSTVKEHFKEIYVACLLYLIKFVKDNSKHQTLVFDIYIDLMDKIEDPDEEVDLIVSIFENNEHLIRSHSSDVLVYFAGLVLRNGRQIKYFKLLNVLIRSADKLSFNLRLEIMRTFTVDPKNKGSITESKTLLYCKGFLKNLEFDLPEKDHLISTDNLVYKDEPFYWHHYILKVLNFCGSDKQCFQRIRELISMQQLLSILLEEDLFGESDSFKFDTFTELAYSVSRKHDSLKKKLRVCESDRIIMEKKMFLKIEIVKILNNIFIPSMDLNPVILKLICEILAFETLRMNSISLDNWLKEIEMPSVTQMTFESLSYSPIKITKQSTSIRYMDYLIQSIIPMISKFIKVRFRGVPYEEISYFREGEYLIRFSIELNEKLKMIASALDEEHTTLLNNFGCKMMPFGIEFTYLKENIGIIEEEIGDTTINYSKTGSLNEFKEELKDKFDIHSLSTHQLINSKKTYRKLEIGWALMVQCLKKNKHVVNAIGMEKEIFGSILMNLKSSSMRAIPLFKNVSLSPKLISTSFIRYILTNFYNKECIETIRFLLCALTHTLELSSTNQEELKIYQNLLNRYEATNMLLSIMSDERFSMDSILFEQLLLFGIMLLLGGNLQIQVKILNYFKSYPRSELIFKRFSRLINNRLQQLRGEEISIKFQDNAKSVNMESIMRFMQLLAEGHNLNLQRYLRFQDMSQVSYDMIRMTADLLAAYFRAPGSGTFVC